MGWNIMKYAFIVSASKNYEKGVIALRNSIKRWCPHIDIILNEAEGVQETAIERFRIAYDKGQEYDAICLLDADMFLTADPTIFFDVASKGIIVTGNNGMIINFDKAHQDKYGVDLGSVDYPYTKTHTTVPIFINKDNLYWFKELYESRRIDSWDDFLYLNILGIKLGIDKKMICMPPYAFTGIHHWQLKPETAVMKKGDLILSGTEEQVYMVHGKWWDEAWLQDLMPTMERYLHDENMGEKCKWRVAQSIELLKAEFGGYLNGISR